MIIDTFRTIKSVCCLLNSSSLHMSFKDSHDLPKIPRAYQDAVDLLWID